MSNTGEILTKFYDALIKRDLATARTFLSDDLVFVGLFETYPNAEDNYGVWISPGGSKFAWFNDPDGNVLSLTEYELIHHEFLV
jgi:hypothetical protein